MKSEKEILRELRRAIAKDAVECNPDDPMQVYDPIELEKLLKSKEQDFRETLTELAEIKGKYSQLLCRFERYLEFLIFLEGNLRILGTSEESYWVDADDPFELGIHQANHKEKSFIAGRLIIQIREVKRRLLPIVYPKSLRGDDLDSIPL